MNQMKQMTQKGEVREGEVRAVEALEDHGSLRGTSPRQHALATDTQIVGGVDPFPTFLCRDRPGFFEPIMFTCSLPICWDNFAFNCSSASRASHALSKESLRPPLGSCFFQFVTMFGWIP